VSPWQHCWIELLRRKARLRVGISLSQKRRLAVVNFFSQLVLLLVQEVWLQYINWNAKCPLLDLHETSYLNLQLNEVLALQYVACACGERSVLVILLPHQPELISVLESHAFRISVLIILLLLAVDSFRLLQQFRILVV
jgi:hypothetical protein